MANALFTLYKPNLLGSGTRVDWDADTMKVTLHDSADVAVLIATHDFYDDVSAGTVASATLAGISTTAGVLDANDTTFSSVSGDQAEDMIFYKDTGVSTTSVLCVFFDTVTGLPVTPNGGNIVVTWNASGIWAIAP